MEISGEVMTGGLVVGILIVLAVRLYFKSTSSGKFGGKGSKSKNPEGDGPDVDIR